MNSNGCHKKEACIARKHLKRRGSEEKRFWIPEADVFRSILIRSTLIRSGSAEAIHQKLTSSEVLKNTRS